MTFNCLHCSSVLTSVVNCSISHRIFIMITQAGSMSPCLLKVIIFTKLTVRGVFGFHACLPAPALKQLSLSSVAFGVRRQIFFIESILNVIDTKCRHIVTEVWGEECTFTSTENETCSSQCIFKCLKFSC